MKKGVFVLGLILVLSLSFVSTETIGHLCSEEGEYIYNDGIEGSTSCCVGLISKLVTGAPSGVVGRCAVDCVGEGESLGAVIPGNDKQCCSGLVPYVPKGIVGTRGTCIYSICPQYSPPADGLCDDGTVIAGKIDEKGCQLPFTCVVDEQIKCVFLNSDELQKCYTSNGGFGCSGIGACIADVSGQKGDKLTWKSSCGGYDYSIIDGINNNVDFDCREESEPVCGNDICERGEGEICEVSELSVCKENEPCEIKKGKCYFGCSEDCEHLPGIYGKFGEKFKLKLEQSIKFESPIILKIKLNAVHISRSCSGIVSTIVDEVSINNGIIGTKARVIESYSISGSVVSSTEEKIACVNGPEIAVLQIKLYKEGKEKTEVIKLQITEKKKIFGVAINFVDYNKFTKTGFFLVDYGDDFECEENCICDAEGEKIECWKDVEKCPEGQKLCQDGYCKEECEIRDITEECNFGCLYNEKCLPYGMRAEELYCAISGDMKTQLDSEEDCDNNFECESNLCIDSECISGGLFKKMMEWFKNFFG